MPPTPTAAMATAPADEAAGDGADDATDDAVAQPAPAFRCRGSGRWRPLAPPGLVGRVDHSAVWTGAEMILWGGTQNARNPFADGARYDQRAAAWHALSRTRAPIERDDHVAVWTGSEMIVWGGNSYREDRDKLDDGGRYDPDTDTWTPTPSLHLTARDDPRAVWTGTEMIVWGGRDARGHTGDGARYDPARNRVRPVSKRGAPAPREDHTAVWTGTEMIVWGGWNGADRARNYALDAAAYDPVKDRWRAISLEGAPDPREDHTAAWTGDEMIVWGGAVREGDPATPRQLGTGGRYDPAADAWRPIAAAEAPEAREDDVVVWTGTEMIVWGGQQAGTSLQTGARYTPAADVWCPMPGDRAPAARHDHAGVWTGQSLVVWGGRGTEGEYLSTGATYEP